MQRPALVAEVALQLAQDRGRGVARELRAALGLEAVDGLDQPEARHLDQVVERLVRVGVAQRQVARERQEPLGQLLARGEVALAVVPDQELPFGLARLVTTFDLRACKARKAGEASAKLHTW